MSLFVLKSDSILSGKQFLHALILVSKLSDYLCGVQQYPPVINVKCVRTGHTYFGTFREPTLSGPLFSLLLSLFNLHFLSFSTTLHSTWTTSQGLDTVSSQIYSRNCLLLVAQLSPTTVVGIAEMPSTTPKPAKVEPPTKPAPTSIQHEPRTSTKDPSVHQAVYYDPSKIPRSIVSRVVAPETSQTPSTAQPPCLENLPVEILQIILSHVPDIGSLDSAARSCPRVCAAFTNRESEFVTAVLGRQIGADLIYDAQFTEACGKHDYWWPREVSESLRQYFAHDLRPVRHLRSPELKLSQAKRLSETHQLVDYFCDKFGSEVLSPLAQVPRRLPGLPTRQLSISERLRISRTLYRFQTYSNLFKHWEYDVESEYMSQAKT